MLETICQKPQYSYEEEAMAFPTTTLRQKVYRALCILFNNPEHSIGLGPIYEEITTSLVEGYSKNYYFLQAYPAVSPEEGRYIVEVSLTREPSLEVPSDYDPDLPSRSHGGHPHRLSLTLLNTYETVSFLRHLYAQYPEAEYYA